MLLAAPPASSGECPKARLYRRRTRCVSFPTHFGSSLGQFPFLPFTSPFCIKLTLVSGTHLASPTSGACGSCKLWYKSVQLPSRRLTLASENCGAEEYGRGLGEPQQASCSPRSCYLHDVFSRDSPCSFKSPARCVPTALPCCCRLLAAVYSTGILCQVCPSVDRGGQEGSLLPSLMTPDCSSRSQDLNSILRSWGAQDMTFSDWGSRDIIPEAHLVRVCFLRPGQAFPPA